MANLKQGGFVLGLGSFDPPAQMVDSHPKLGKETEHCKWTQPGSSVKGFGKAGTLGVLMEKLDNPARI